jgi:hypothetical protein
LFAITQYISCSLLFPKLGIGLRHYVPVLAIMAVPIAAMNEDNSLPAWKHEIGLSWQLPSMEHISKAKSMDQAPHEHLRFGVLAPDGGHVRPPPF